MSALPPGSVEISRTVFIPHSGFARSTFEPRRNRHVMVSHIQAVVAGYFEIDPEDMTSQCRRRSVARPRQVAMYFARVLSHKSYPDIGRMFGGRDHSTAMFAERQVKQLIATDARFAEQVLELGELLSGKALP